MPRATWLADVLADAGLLLRPYPGWATRGGSAFNPVGVMWHHTVTGPSTADVVVDKFLATTGSSTTPAPLCNYSTNRDGTISLIAAGTANHGGKGTYGGVAGNSRWFGDEMKNRGTSVEPWPERQLESARLATAAILDHLRKDADWLCAHKEYATPPGRKSDPHTLNMDAERLTVAALMEDGMWQKPGDKVVTLADARAVNSYQGWSFWTQADFDYDENDPAALDERNKVVSARIIDWMMRHP